MLEENKHNLSTLATGASKSPVSYADALENYRRNTDWWIIADALDLPNANSSPLWLSGKTGISVESVSEALEGMLVLGLLVKTSKGLEKTKTDFTIPFNDQTKAQKMEDHALISRQILNHLNENARGALRFASFASNVEIIVDLYKKIDQALLEAQEQSRKLPKEKLDNVYLASYTSITSLPANNGKGAPNA